MSPAWVLCDVTNGMFSDEYSVIIQNLQGANVSLFAPKNAIRYEGDKSYLQVGLITDNIVALPSETMETGTSAVSVPASSIRR